MTPTSIEIDRLPLTFLTAAASDRVELVWRRARDALVRSLPAQLDALYGGELDRDDAYVFVDRLDVACAIRADWPDDRMTATFAERLAGELHRERELGRAIVFRDRAEYLSAFLAAVVAGDAFSRWWFAEFDGLRPLPTSARVRTLVSSERDLGWAALARLTPGLIHDVASVLLRADAERMISELDRRPPTVNMPQLVDAFDRVRTATLPTSVHRVMVALIELVRTGNGSVSSGDAAALTAIAAIVETAERGRLGPPVASPVATVAEWCRVTGVDDVGRMAVLGLEPSSLVDFVQARVPDPEMGPVRAPDESIGFTFTPNGGALLLAVVLVRTGWWRDWRDAISSTAGDRADAIAGSLALRVIARALSPRRPSVVEQDAALWAVFGRQPPPGSPDRPGAASRAALLGSSVTGPGSLAGWLRQQARELLAEFARSVPGCDGSSHTYLQTRLLSVPAAVDSAGTSARMGRAPIDVLLGMSGLKRASVDLPDGRRLVLSEDLGP